MSETVYKPEELVRLRTLSEMTQAQMASTMGISRRAYQALEVGQNPTKRHHIMLARYALLQKALADRRLDSLPDDMIDEVKDLVDLWFEMNGVDLNALLEHVF